MSPACDAVKYFGSQNSPEFGVFRAALPKSGDFGYTVNHVPLEPASVGPRLDAKEVISYQR